MIDIDTTLLLFKPLMTRFDKIDNLSYVCIFERFKHAENFGQIMRDLDPMSKVIVKGLYVKIMYMKDEKVKAGLKRHA